jgi:aminopeptidase Y
VAFGVPSGGIFTGIDEIKTAEQAALFGGTAGAPFDPCYHRPCDGNGNYSRTALIENADAIGFVLGRYAIYAGDIPNTEPVAVSVADRQDAARVDPKAL